MTGKNYEEERESEGVVELTETAIIDITKTSLFQRFQGVRHKIKSGTSLQKALAYIGESENSAQARATARQEKNDLHVYLTIVRHDKKLMANPLFSQHYYQAWNGLIKRQPLERWKKHLDYINLFAPMDKVLSD